MRYTLGMVHGVFDLLHVGHVWHLVQAKSHCERLIVSLVADRFVKKPGRPIMSQEDRKYMLMALRMVDRVLITSDETPNENIRAMCPDVWIRGEEYKGQAKPEDEILRKLGIPRIYTPSMPVTTSSLIVRIRETSLHCQ